MRMHRVACAVSLILLVASTASATSGEYIFILRARGNPYWGLIAQGARDAAKEHNVDATVYEMESESSTEEQLNVCQAAIERAPTLIAICLLYTSPSPRD